MQRVTIFILCFFCGTIFLFSAPVIPETVEEIRVSLNSEAEINNALFILKKNDPESFNELEKLRKEDPDTFINKLRKRYYSWIHTQVLEKKRKTPKKGYREQVKNSEIQIKELKSKYKTASASDKETIKNQIKNAAENRYQIELEQLEYHIWQSQQFLENQQKKAERFKENREAFVNRLVNKTINT